jgi:hypothetical protein
MKKQWLFSIFSDASDEKYVGPFDTYPYNNIDSYGAPIQQNPLLYVRYTDPITTTTQSPRKCMNGVRCEEQRVRITGENEYRTSSETSQCWSVIDCMGHWVPDLRVVAFDSEAQTCAKYSFRGNVGLKCTHDSGDSEYVICINSDVHINWTSTPWD